MNRRGDGVWVFGYGSLIWRPDLPFREQRVAYAQGWTRRFWQGSHDHRGLPHAPGRVVTIVPGTGVSCGGMAYFVEVAAICETWDELDDREKNGYQRETVRLTFRGGASDGTAIGAADGAVYVAPVGNSAWLGPAPFPEIARQILRSEGLSGTNIDYMRQLAGALRRFGIKDDHVFRLERHVEDLARQARSRENRR